MGYRNAGHIRLSVIWVIAIPISILLCIVDNAKGQNNFSYPGGDYNGNRIGTLPDTNEILRTLQEPPGYAEADVSDSAITYFQRLLQQSRQTNYSYGIIATLSRLGILYKNKGLYEQSIHAFQEAISYCQQTGREPALLAKIYNGIGNVYLVQGAYEQAAAYYYKATIIAENFPVQTASAIGSIYNNLAGVLNRLHQWQKALYYLDKAEHIARAQDNNRLLGNALHNKGCVYINQKDWDKSLQYLKAALSVSRKSNLPALQHMSLTSIGTAYLEKGMPERALASLLEAKNLAVDIPPFNENAFMLAISKAYFQMKDYKQAEHFLLQVLRKAEVLGLDDNQRDAHKNLAYLYAATGDYRKAYIHKESLEELIDKIENQETVKNIHQLEIKYHTAQKDKEIIKNQLQISEQKHHIEKKNILITVIIAGIVLLTVLLIGANINYRHKQRLQANRIRLLQQEKELSEKEQEIKELKATMQGEEKERTRIARELHDGIVSQLAAVRLNFSALSKDESYAQDFDDALQQLSDVTQELRITAQNLTPEILLQNGLVEAVHTFCEKMAKATGLEIDFQVYGDLPLMETDFELSLYRMVQELIHNVIKHAQATQLLVQFSYQNERLGITIEDNGIGLSREIINRSKGTGLNNIYARVKILNGHMDIVNDESGTTIYLEFCIYHINNENSLC